MTPLEHKGQGLLPGPYDGIADASQQSTTCSHTLSEITSTLKGAAYATTLYRVNKNTILNNFSHLLLS